MLQNAYLLAKIGADTAENEQHFAEILPKKMDAEDKEGRAALLVLRVHLALAEGHPEELRAAGVRGERAQGPRLKMRNPDGVVC